MNQSESLMIDMIDEVLTKHDPSTHNLLNLQLMNYELADVQSSDQEIIDELKFIWLPLMRNAENVDMALRSIEETISVRSMADRCRKWQMLLTEIRDEN